MRTHARDTRKGADLATPSLRTTYHFPPHNSLWVAHPVATEDMSRVKHSLKPIQCGCGTAMAHWSRPQTSNFCIAPVPPKWLLCAHPAEDKALSESAAIKRRIPKGRTQAISYTQKKKPDAETWNLLPKSVVFSSSGGCFLLLYTTEHAFQAQSAKRALIALSTWQ